VLKNEAEAFKVMRAQEWEIEEGEDLLVTLQGNLIPEGRKTPKLEPRRNVPKGYMHNCQVFPDEYVKMYPHVADMYLKEDHRQRISKAMCFWLRGGLKDAGYPSYTVGRKSEFYDMVTLAEVVQNQHRYINIDIHTLAYVAYWDEKGRYFMFCKGHDPRLQVAGSHMLIRTNAGFRGESQSMNADDMYDDSDLLKPEQLPTQYLYHGTYKSVWRLIVDDKLRAGGLKGNRLHNRYSPYPPGDSRKTGGARIDAEVSVPGMGLPWDVRGPSTGSPLLA
jgi:RNA:NAD 2'-phosphotransferase (TPT1/KptA family)